MPDLMEMTAIDRFLLNWFEFRLFDTLQVLVVKQVTLLLCAFFLFAEKRFADNNVVDCMLMLNFMEVKATIMTAKCLMT